MEPHFINYQINHKFQKKIINSRKKTEYYCRKLRKKKVNTKIRFRNYSSRLAGALSPIRAGRDRAVEKMFMKRLPRTSYHLDISGNTGTTDHT